MRHDLRQPLQPPELAETLAAKLAFETFATEHGVRIQHYHCNNGRFYDNAFKQACHDVR